jgi:hypothetical protein
MLHCKQVLQTCIRREVRLMAKTQEMKGELSPATAVIVIVVAALIIGILGWLFFFRQAAPVPVTGTSSGVSTMQGPPMPPPPGAPTK